MWKTAVEGTFLRSIVPENLIWEFFHWGKVTLSSLTTSLFRCHQIKTNKTRRQLEIDRRHGREHRKTNPNFVRPWTQPWQNVPVQPEFNKSLKVSFVLDNGFISSFQVISNNNNVVWCDCTILLGMGGFSVCCSVSGAFSRWLWSAVRGKLLGRSNSWQTRWYWYFPAAKVTEISVHDMSHHPLIGLQLQGPW